MTKFFVAALLAVSANVAFAQTEGGGGDGGWVSDQPAHAGVAHTPKCAYYEQEIANYDIRGNYLGTTCQVVDRESARGYEGTPAHRGVEPTLCPSGTTLTPVYSRGFEFVGYKCQKNTYRETK